ncbi:hypothetical protein M0R45_004018 [Rubus argutus]|uniref:Uncharacterized protein n=1 Tax=Rubus argutus TaxID=59490 RepID=A0AAW1YI50_RUBAR
MEVADALAVKLLQRFNYSVTAMKTSSQHLSGVHALQVEIGELKGRLTELSATAHQELQSTSSDLQRDPTPSVSSGETKLD